MNNELISQKIEALAVSIGGLEGWSVPIEARLPLVAFRTVDKNGMFIFGTARLADDNSKFELIDLSVMKHVCTYDVEEESVMSLETAHAMRIMHSKLKTA